MSDIQKSKVEKLTPATIGEDENFTVTIDCKDNPALDFIFLMSGDSTADLSVYGYAIGHEAIEVADALLEATEIDTDGTTHTVSVKPVTDYVHVDVTNTTATNVTVSGVVIKKQSVSPSQNDISDGLNVSL